nr:unnamed protein product [Digitaria exilis]
MSPPAGLFIGRKLQSNLRRDHLLPGQSGKQGARSSFDGIKARNNLPIRKIMVAAQV